MIEVPGGATGSPMAEILEIAGAKIAPGERVSVQIPVARRYTHGEVIVPAHVVRGRQAGPCLFVCAAIHGDEINGVEIIRRLLRSPRLSRLRGTLIAVPVVNIYGFASQSRYLPDRRDLNRSFPGSPRGSLASRLAHRFMTEVVDHSTHGIDLHTGAIHRENLPQIRACLDDAPTEALARAFGTPVVLNANLRDGSLRQAVLERAIPMLVYEAGEALRFDELSIRAGLRGILAVMRSLEMLRGRPPATPDPFVARSSTWVRAPESGILRTALRPGQRVSEGETLGMVSDPLGDRDVAVVSPSQGVVIGRTRLPLVNEGDALFHVASFDRPLEVAARVETDLLDLDPDPAGDLGPP